MKALLSQSEVQDPIGHLDETDYSQLEISILRTLAGASKPVSVNALTLLIKDSHSDRVCQVLRTLQRLRLVDCISGGPPVRYWKLKATRATTP